MNRLLEEKNSYSQANQLNGSEIIYAEMHNAFFVNSLF